MTYGLNVSLSNFFFYIFFLELNFLTRLVFCDCVRDFGFGYVIFLYICDEICIPIILSWISYSARAFFIGGSLVVDFDDY
jgi:hypothetical protein